MPGYQDAISVGILPPPPVLIVPVDVVTLTEFIRLTTLLRPSKFETISLTELTSVAVPFPSIVLAWNANTEPDLSGYKLYLGRASGVYNDPRSPTSVGNVLTRSMPITAPGAWFFALTAVNTGGLESGFSNEVSATF